MLKGPPAWLQASTVAGGRHSVVTDYMLRLLVSQEESRCKPQGDQEIKTDVAAVAAAEPAAAPGGEPAGGLPRCSRSSMGADPVPCWLGCCSKHLLVESRAKCLLPCTPTALLQPPAICLLPLDILSFVATCFLQPMMC